MLRRGGGFLLLGVGALVGLIIVVKQHWLPAAYFFGDLAEDQSVGSGKKAGSGEDDESEKAVLRADRGRRESVRV